MPAIEYLRPSILDDLPPDGHAIIEASAGTGKTYAIEHLIVELLRRDAKSIEEILVVTFTEKATTELRARIRGLIEMILRGAPAGASQASDGHSRTAIDDAARLRLEHALAAFERAPIFTIHAFCRRVLTEFAFDSGTRFTLELDDGRRAFRSAFRAELRERFAVDPLMREGLTRWLEEADATALENLLSEAHRCRYQPTDRERTIAEARKVLAAQGPIEPLLSDLYLPLVEKRLDRDKRQRGQIDYDDMLAWVWEALEGSGGPALAAALRLRYRFALVDEFQDTDDLQWRIFKRVFVEGDDGNRLFVVGDPKQAIYAFRNADVHSYLRARKELCAAGAPRIPIDANFRSTAKLIDACNLIFDQKAQPPLFDGAITYDRPVTCGVPDRVALDARGRAIVPIKLMRYEPPPGQKGKADDTREQIGRFIAATIKRLLEDPASAIEIQEQDRKSATAIRRKVAAREIFVLAATNEDCRTVGGFLRAAGVPFAYYRLDGLFEKTDEAKDVLAILRALEDLNDRSRRRRAWMSPFFALKFREIATIADPPASHPLNQLLYEWRTLAEAERFAELFDRLLHQSGLTDREIFLKQGERELTNYIHIFELLLERAVADRLSLTEIIELLDDYIGMRAQPPGQDGNIQRIESERIAVQVMTVHMSKGLEADVVMLFGGLNRGAQTRPVAIYHEDGERRFAIGKAAQNDAKASIKRERAEEDQRLLYVALTRARAKLYLPFYPDGSIRKPTGYYAQLNQRLREVIESRDGAKSTARRAEQIEIADARESSAALATQRSTIPLAQWMPPAELLADRSEPESVFNRLATARAALRMRSYTSLKHESGAWELAPPDFKTDLATTFESEDLPGGSSVGLFLHEVIERLDFEALTAAGSLASWRQLAGVQRLFHDSMQRHLVRDPRWFNRGTEMVFRTLTSPIATAGGRMIEALGRCRNTREMEFLFPIPEASHPRLGGDPAESWRADRGYLKGYIDFIFEDDGLIYFADWKSDLLPDYRAETIRGHVERNYQLQALIYSVGVARLLRIRSEADYRRRFGGFLFVFLRGVGAEPDGEHGIYFQRPDWSEIRLQETALTNLSGLA